MKHKLAFHDAGWAATARELGVALGVGADRLLLEAVVAESPTRFAVRLRLPER